MPPSALRRFQYELCDSAENSLLVFGTEDTGYLTMTRPGFESAEMTVNNGERGNEDGWMPGRDYLSNGGLHTFEIGVLTDALNGLAVAGGGLREQVNLDYIDQMKTLWRDRRWRLTPGSHAILRKAMPDGSQWRTYGRPRKFDSAEGNTTQEGYTPILCDFEPFEEGWYSDEVESASVSLRMVDENGLLSPLVAPITTVGEASAVAGFTVGGSRMTWPRATFVGPVLNPSVVIGQGPFGNLVLGLTGQVGSGESVEIDTAPWRRVVQRTSDGANRAGMLSADTPSMSDALLRPGDKTLVYRGIDATGTSYATVEWRRARTH